MRYTTLMLLALVGCHPDRLIAYSECGLPCGATASAPLDKGVCHPGINICDDTGNVIRCEGAVLPSAEICDNQDNDCNGQVDGFILSCKTACGHGSQHCVDGMLGTCWGPHPTPEVCNGLDDDCDGVIDNPEAMSLALCYSRDPKEMLYPNSACMPGIERCMGGKMVCIGEKVPSPEVCDGIDNDCNGKIDDDSRTPADLDIVVVMDTSGSMGPIIVTVQATVAGFQQKYTNRPDLHWALVDAPDPDISFGSHPTLAADFTNAAGFLTALNRQQATGSGAEPTIDALDMLIDPANPLKLSWRPGARKAIIVFSDEEPQAYYTSETYLTIGAKISNLPFQPLADVIVFTNTSEYWTRTTWDIVLGPAKVFSIYSIPSDMSADMEKIIKLNSCTP